VDYARPHRDLDPLRREAEDVRDALVREPFVTLSTFQAAGVLAVLTGEGRERAFRDRGLARSLTSRGCCSRALAAATRGRSGPAAERFRRST
jgi:hypothetical protein